MALGELGCSCWLDSCCLEVDLEAFAFGKFVKNDFVLDRAVD